MGQRRIGYTTYTGELRWDDWPYRLCDPQLLYTLVLVWLGDHANDLREELGLEDPDIDPQPIDEQTAIVSVSVPLGGLAGHHRRRERANTARGDTLAPGRPGGADC
ncbi:P2 phage tail completion protein R (GpR) [Serratia quinivorans]|uniref:P2 phage tail completion protein R (GpR) n=1 Tax=Serratia quinivorans TaxID=137545 RepID=A0A380A9I5_9GAMM|nr:P2 phage tail completion protein R (GpR) [Serratia quinivorans]